MMRIIHWCWNDEFLVGIMVSSEVWNEKTEQTIFRVTIIIIIISLQLLLPWPVKCSEWRLIFPFEECRSVRGVCANLEETTEGQKCIRNKPTGSGSHHQKKEWSCTLNWISESIAFYWSVDLVTCGWLSRRDTVPKSQYHALSLVPWSRNSK